MIDWMTMPLRRYADFSGRSRRKEYWSFTLFVWIVYAVFAALMFAGGFSPSGYSTGTESLGVLFYVGAALIGLFGLAVLVPTVAVGVRRLHDRNMSGWWYLGFIALSMIPFVGLFAGAAMFVIMCLEGTKGSNRFGADPKDPHSVDVFA